MVDEFVILHVWARPPSPHLRHPQEHPTLGLAENFSNTKPLKSLPWYEEKHYIRNTRSRFHLRQCLLIGESLLPPSTSGPGLPPVSKSLLPLAPTHHRLLTAHDQSP